MLHRPFAAAAGLTLALGLSLPMPALAETSLTAYDAARQALMSIWDELPLSVRNVTLTEETATNYGNYTPRADDSVRLGEPIHVYVEVLGYGWKDNGDGTFSELLDADLSLLNANGTTVASQQNFLNADIRSREKLLETFLTFEATLSAFEPGDYRLHYVLHDRAGGEEASFDVPIRLVGDSADASSEAPSASSSGAAASQ